MRSRWLLLAVCCLLPALGVGCGAFETTSNFAQSHFVDRPDPTARQNDAWVDEAGREARGSKKREVDPDGWWWKYFTSEKARSIERNMGVDYE